MKFKALVLVLVVLFAVPSMAAVGLANGDTVISPGTIGIDLLGGSVTSAFTTSSEVNSLADARIGAASIEDLSDVSPMIPADNQVLTWDSGAGRWTAETAATGGDMYKASYATASEAVVDEAFELNAIGVGNGLEKVSASVEVKLDGGTLSKSASGMKISDSGVDTTQIASDAVDDSKVDFGTGAGQVSGGDIPIVDAGGYFSTHEVESSLQELGAAFAGAITVDKIERAIEGFTTDGANYVCNLTYTPLLNPVLYWGDTVIQTPGIGYSIDKEAKTCTIIGGSSGVHVTITYEYIIP